MQDYLDATVRDVSINRANLSRIGVNDHAGGPLTGSALLITIFDGHKEPYNIDLSSFRKSKVTFGRTPTNDIVLVSPLVSHDHGYFLLEKGVWKIVDKDSTNGLIYDNMSIKERSLGDGDFIRVDDGIETVPEGVLFIFSTLTSSNKWLQFQNNHFGEITIGRKAECNIVLPHVSVSKLHAKIVLEDGQYYLIDQNSTNGIIVNGKQVKGKVLLHEKDVIVITNSKLIFTKNTIFYCCFKSGISVEAVDVVIRRGKGRKSFITCNHTTVSVKPGELVAIIGGSGAGKSTVLNSMCGYLQPTSGDIYINGTNLYHNFDSLKKLIGYVPQSDIVYDNLTLYDMLMYTAKLRLPKDISKTEREAIINRAIETVELTEKKDSMIKALSGGQRKRASIAVELLADPNLLFLDEPASGLDPGTERNLMQSLRQMADDGKTVILVTHSTLQLQMCDKIIFMGKGGNLCFFGSYDEALSFFGVSDIVDIYNLITEQAPKWKQKFRDTEAEQGKVRSSASLSKHTNEKCGWRQLFILCIRYFKLLSNDRQRLLLILLQAPVLALLISFVADGKQYDQYEMTKSLLFALSCSAFWIGMLNSIQEICKERTIVKREYMTGLSLTAYIASKIIVLGVLCMLQCVLVVGVFTLLIGLPESGVFLPVFAEIYMTTLLTALASVAMGLLVSALFTNADRAMTVAPILLMPQILFSGLIFKLDGATKIISWFAICRWSMEGYGTSANLNDLPLRLQQEGIMIQHEAESFFEFTIGHLLCSWGIMIGFSMLFLVVARCVMSKIKK